MSNIQKLVDHMQMTSISEGCAKRCVTHSLACDCREYRIQALLEAVRDSTDTLRIVAFGKSEGPYSAMYRIRAARETLENIEAKFGELLSE